jgi:hypothetical protein
MFAQVQATVIADIPGGVREPRTLVRLLRPVAFPVYEDLRDGSTEFFSGFAGYIGPVPVTLVNNDRREHFRAWGHLTSPEYFEVLGIRPALGRLFDSHERNLGAQPVVVLSDRLWRTRFGGQPAVINQAIGINGQLATVIGVAPRDFAGPAPMTAAADLWIPATVGSHIAPELSERHNRNLATVAVIGRLAPGVSVDQAERALETISQRIEHAYGEPE